MRRVLAFAIVALMLAIPFGAMAHVKNEETQFPDIEFSDARFDIVLLAAAGVVPETPVFEPDRLLTRHDLASWIALSEGLGQGGETPDTGALAKAALAAGRIASLEGEATFGEVATAFFGGEVKTDDENAVPTKEEAASFLAAHLTAPVDGTTLLARAGVAEGPTGQITQVRSEKTADGDNAFFITIGTVTAPAYQHVRVANGTTDLLAWQGRVVRRSLTRQFNGNTLWIYIEAEPAAAPPATAGADAQEPPAQTTDQGMHAGNALFYGLLAGVVVLGVLLFARRKRHP